MTLVTTDRRRPGRCPGRTAGRPVRAGAGRADLPDLGADLRLQPGLRALPVELGPARPRRADHRRVQGDSSTSSSGCRSSTSTSAAASPPSGPTSGSWSSTPPTTTSGVKFSTNGSRITAEVAERLAASDYVDVQISLDGATADGQRRRARRRLLSPPPSPPWSAWPRPGSPASSSRWWSPARTSASSMRSRRSPTATAPSSGSPGCGPSGRGADVWDELHPTAAQQRTLYDWLVAHGEDVLTGDSFFHLAGYGESAARAQPLRRGPGGLPGRSGRRRLRLPVRHPRRVPGRQRALARRLRRGLAPLGPVHRAPPAPERRGVRLVRALRRLPGRVHGGQVLHRPPARRPRPRMRPRPRRALAGRPRRAPAAPAVARPLAPTRAGRPVALLPRRARPGLRREPAGRLRRRPPARAERWPAWSTPWRWPAGPPRRGWCSAPTRPTWAAVASSATAMWPTTGPGRPAARASWSPRRPRSTRRTGPTSGPRWPRRAGPGGRPWPRPAARTAPWCWPGSATAGGQGSSAYSQSVMWAPSRVADVVNREMPVEMEQADIDALVARLRRRPPGWPSTSGLDGVEVDAGYRLPAAPVPLGAHQPAGRRATDRTVCA